MSTSRTDSSPHSATSEIEPVVVGIDGSPGSAYALAWAAEEARLRGARLEVVHAWAPPLPPVPSRAFENADAAPYERDAKALVEHALDDAGLVDHAEPRVHPVVVRGYPPAVLLEQGSAGLLVVGTRGRGGFRSLLLGSVSQHCATHTTAPMVVVRPDAPLPTSAQDVVVGVDGSSGSARALDVALAEAARRHVRLSVVHGWSFPYSVPPMGFGFVPPDRDVLVDGSRRMLDELVDAAVSRAPAQPPRLELVPIEAAAAPALLAKADDAALLVVGARGRGGFSGMVLGSVSQQCLHHARCAVMVVPEPEHAR